ncbi:MAG: cysteine desulfurase family protein [Calditerrivibrio sp.]|uniref:cysteine desulfurase family protein n=1 Tax=Calditerrivibrio sp. TaxID=2792612 RepID=UPI003D11E28F
MAIYFDNSATTKVDERVFESMIPYFKERFANPSSIHIEGRSIREDVEKAREIVAKTISALPEEIIFCSSGTESDNLAIKGIAFALKGKGKHIITSNIEHKAVQESCKYLEENGFDVTYLPVKKDGIIDIEDFKNALRDDTILVSIMLANNEIGTIQPIKEIGQLARKHGFILHTDAVQAVGKMNVDVCELGVHLLSFSGHKIYAPKGIGVLYIDKELKNLIQPIIHGGHQEFGIRSGTENVPYIIGISEACRIIQNELDKDIKHISAIRDRFEERVLSEIPDVYVNGDKDKRVCNISNITFRHIEAEALMVYASEICCSTGSACSSGDIDASHVLKAIKVDPVDIHGSIRFSFGRFNAIQEVDTAVDILKASVQKLREMSPLYKK